MDCWRINDLAFTDKRRPADSDKGRAPECMGRTLKQQGWRVKVRDAFLSQNGHK